MAIPYLALGIAVVIGSIFGLIMVLSALRRRRAARLTPMLAQRATMLDTNVALVRPEDDTPVVLPFIASDPHDDTQPIFPVPLSQADFIPIVAFDDEEPTQPEPPSRRVIEHDPDLPAFTIEPDAKAIHPQRTSVARLIAFFEREGAKTTR